MELSAGLMFSCCSREERSWQELKFQQVNPAGKHLLRMFWLAALELRRQQQVVPRVSMRRSCAAVCPPVCPPASLDSPLVTGMWGDLLWQCKWTTQLKPLQKFLLFCHFFLGNRTEPLQTTTKLFSLQFDLPAVCKPELYQKNMYF